MKRKYTLKVGESYTFTVGQTDNYLILRDASHSITLESDEFKDVELTRSDTVIITDYRNMELRFLNNGAEPIYFEFQLSEVDIRIKEQRMSVAGGIVVDEIIKPVVVSEIQQPVSIDNFPKSQIVTCSGKSAASNKYAIEGTTARIISYKSASIKSILIQPEIDVFIGADSDALGRGLSVKAGSTMVIESGADIYACGAVSGVYGSIRTFTEYF